MATATSETLRDQLLARLDSAEGLAGDAGELVLAACTGPDALTAALDPSARELETAAPEPVATQIAPAYLRSITVEGFRGIGQAATLQIAPGAGLTLIVGRNGSGKSSFAEAVELLLTGKNARWEGRTSVWRDGWRSLHHPTTRIEAAFAVDGVEGEMVVRTTWADGASSVDERDQTVLPAGRSTLAWETALERFRPFLSYSELGRMFERPSALYESLNAVLGLGHVDDMLALLARARIDADNAGKELRAKTRAFCAQLADIDDARAAVCAAALAGKEPDLDALELSLDETIGGEGDATLLRALCALSLPDAETARRELGELAAAIERHAELDASDAGRAAQLATLLAQALDAHAGHDSDCRVCGGSLPAEWRERTELEVARLRAQSEEHSEATRALSELLKRALALAPASPPAAVERAAEAGLDPARAVAAWESWAAACEPVLTLPGAGGAALDEIRDSVGELAAAAEAQLAAADAVWRPLQRSLGDWLPAARAEQVQAARFSALRQAETWLLGAGDELREERLAPIRDAAIATWNELRHESNVTLGAIKLTGKGKARHADFDVSVDATGASALGVMSQGELHALALSVFLPRAMRDESPFRFVMIDDPVQSMDPAKVDGLARVLAAAAATRQVIVFTHDERLADATRRLGLGARITEVRRHEGSLVETRNSHGPVQQAIADARALLRDDHVSSLVKSRVVPSFCREAIEAACCERVRRRRLERGDSHADVEEVIRNATTLLRRVALAEFDDPDRAGDARARVASKFGQPAAVALSRCNAGAHGADSGEALEELVGECARLSTKLSK